MAGDSAPKTIGRYAVERLLGQGGMGRVYLARDTNLGRRVAIKVLRDDLALPPRVRDELVERMRHEAQAAAAVSHPNIVTLHDMGEDLGEQGVGLYLVFEYVTSPDAPDGKDEPQSLRDRLKRGPLALTEVAKLARELGTALSFAHEAGVIHRDVKPENILFSRTGAKIADFGIARIPESTITRANTVLGTPAYTAPEALSKGDFGPASDQFALAATLYEAITAARAFGGDDAITTAGRVSNEQPPPIHESIASETVLRNLEAALQRGLAKDPKERFASAAELGEAVGRAIDAPVLPDVLEVERTPLSSRMVIITERTSSPPGSSETPLRPSIMIRQKTHRAQNIVAAIALLVIIVLVLLGRKSNDDVRDAAKDASADATPSAAAPPARPHKSAPKTSATPSAAAAAAAPTTADAGAEPESARDE
jgi:eukaryotic-like serine/threonine-protein kinase